MGFDINEINLVKFQDRKWNFRKEIEQAGSELCQAQFS